MGSLLVIWLFLCRYYSSIEAGTLKISETQPHLLVGKTDAHSLRIPLRNSAVPISERSKALT